MGVKKKVVYVGHIVDNPIRDMCDIQRVCQQLSTSGFIPLSPLLMFPHINRSTKFGSAQYRDAVKELFRRKTIDQFFICSVEDTDLRIEKGWAKEFNIPIVDIYSDASHIQNVKELKYVLKTDLQGWAKKGVEAYLEENDDAQDKSGALAKVHEAVNVLSAILSSRYRSVATSEMHASADEPTE